MTAGSPDVSTGRVPARAFQMQARSQTLPRMLAIPSPVLTLLDRAARFAALSHATHPAIGDGEGIASAAS
jgi:hypothetical protein